jgi:hypothetical protein
MSVDPPPTLVFLPILIWTRREKKTSATNVSNNKALFNDKL